LLKYLVFHFFISLSTVFICRSLWILWLFMYQGAFRTDRRVFYYDMSLVPRFGEFRRCVLCGLVDVEKFVPCTIWCSCSSCVFRWFIGMQCLVSYVLLSFLFSWLEFVMRSAVPVGVILRVMNCIHLSQDRDQWRAFVNTIMNVRVP
jgi:hypothetical protein